MRSLRTLRRCARVVAPVGAARSHVLARGLQTKVVRLHKHGKPSEAFSLETEELNTELAPDQVLVRMMVAPINPSDLDVAYGTYGTLPQSLPAVAGNDGVGVVEAVGSGVRGLAVNDAVAPAAAGLGTWRSHLVASEAALCKLGPKVGQPEGEEHIPFEYAAAARNVVTAMRLLEDFAALQEGDVVLQNAATSHVGQCVLQLAAARGVKTINVIRARPDQANAVEQLKHYGGYIVITEDYLNTPAYRRLVADLPPPKLALNATGGYGATELARALGQGGTMVTYGAMSRKPVQVAASHLLFKDLTLRGFWLQHWQQQAGADQVASVQAEVERLLTFPAGEDTKSPLRMWMEQHPLSDFNAALKRNAEPYRGRKVILQLQE